MKFLVRFGIEKSLVILPSFDELGIFQAAERVVRTVFVISPICFFSSPNRMLSFLLSSNKTLKVHFPCTISSTDRRGSSTDPV